MNGSDRRETAVLGGGCFWCIEAVYERIDGVKSAVSGYAGGEREGPSYEQVSTGLTGHAEVVEIEFDPDSIDYSHILDIFFSVHDPMTRDRQGADVGSQYRSIILYTTEDQKKIAERKIAELNASGHYQNELTTELVPLTKFWPAEDYHQDYYELHPYAGYCRIVIAPKLKKAGLNIGSLIKEGSPGSSE